MDLVYFLFIFEWNFHLIILEILTSCLPFRCIRYPLSATFCHLPLVHQNPLSLFFPGIQLFLQFEMLLMDSWRCALPSLASWLKIIFPLLLSNCLYTGFFREDCPTSVGVVDKINIFRSDRVFMVMIWFLILSIPYTRAFVFLILYALCSSNSIIL